jgi:hypothetical protein
VKVIATEIDIKTAKAVKSLGDVEKAIKKAGDEQERLKKQLKETTDKKSAEKLKGQIDKLSKSISNLKDRQKELKEANDLAFNKIDSSLNGIPSKLKGFIGGVKGLTKGFGVLRTAVIATGIGALVVVVASAVEWFSNFDAAVKIVSTAMDSFNGALGQLGTALDLLIKGEFKAAGEAMTQVGKAALEASKDSQRLFDVTKELQELQAKNIPLNAKLRQDLELQKRILEDTTLSEKERLAALENVTALSEQIQKNNITENKLKVEQLTLEAKLENNAEQKRLKNIELANAQRELIDQEGQLNIIRKDAEKVEREILAISRQAKNEQLQEELRLQKELLKAEKERDAAKLLSFLKFKALLGEEEVAEKKLAGKKFKLKEDEKKQVITLADLKRVAASDELALAQNVLGNLSGALEKNAKAQKAIQIAQTSIQTFQGAVSAFSAAQIIPPPAGQIIGAANAAAVVAMGLANINKIKNTKIPTGGGSSSANGNATLPRNNSSAGVGFNPSTPTISALPNFNQTAIGQQGQGSNVKAYVLQDDIQNQAALNKRINQKTTL